MNDTYLRSFTGPDDNDGMSALGGPIDGTHYSAPLKFTSGLTNFTFINQDVVTGGKNAAVDVNNKCQHLEIELSRVIPRGEFVATSKGGAEDVLIKIESLLGHGKVCDLITDDWSDQSHDPTKGVRYDVTAFDHSPITVIALKEPPTFIGGGPYVFLFPWPWINPRWLGYPCGKAFEVLRRWGFFRGAA